MFFSACLAVVTLTICDALKSGDGVDELVNTYNMKYGTFDTNPWTLKDIPAFCIMGFFGGLLGAFFVSGNYFFSKLRKAYVNTKPKKVIEACIIVGITATIIFFSPIYIKNLCYEVDGSNITGESVFYKNGLGDGSIALRY